MGRVATKIEIPVRKPVDFLELTKKIIAKNEELGKESPLLALKQVDMVAYKAKVEKAIKLRLEAEALRNKSESLMEEANALIGVGLNQTSLTEGTLYNVTNTIKEYLVVTNKTLLEKLSEWGFRVVSKKVGTGVKNTPVEPKK